METIQRYGHLELYNRINVLKLVEKELAKRGAKILVPNYFKEVKLTVFTDEESKEHKEKVANLPPTYFLGSDGFLAPRLSFVLDGYFYDIQYNDNPFFPINYEKIKVDDEGKYVGQRYRYDNDDPIGIRWEKTKASRFSFAYDRLFCINTVDQLGELANFHLSQITDFLIKGPESARYRDKKRRSCYYNGKRHWEYIYIYDEKTYNLFGEGTYCYRIK